MKKEELIKKAESARELAYAPYSKFKVGAALLTKDGQVFLGANIENSSYPLCMCAERNALYNAMLHGYKKADFVALALTADTDEPCSPHMSPLPVLPRCRLIRIRPASTTSSKLP